MKRFNTDVIIGAISLVFTYLLFIYLLFAETLKPIDTVAMLFGIPTGFGSIGLMLYLTQSRSRKRSAYRWFIEEWGLPFLCFICILSLRTVLLHWSIDPNRFLVRFMGSASTIFFTYIFLKAWRNRR